MILLKTASSIGSNFTPMINLIFSFPSIASAADYLTTSSQPQTPQVHFHNSSLSRTVPRGQRTVMMTSGGLGNSGVAGGQSNQYRTFHTSR